MSVVRLNGIELSSVLVNKGLSDVGQKSITDNDITGEMLLEFCEDDIQDAFSVFKDRFIIRKVLREQKLLESNNQTLASPGGIQSRKISTDSPSLQYRKTVSPNNYTQHQIPTHTATRSSPSGQQDIIHSQSHEQQHVRSVISLVNTGSEKVVPVQIHHNQNYSPQPIAPPSPSTLSRSNMRRPSSELMNARVSSTDEYKSQRKMLERPEESQSNVYDSAIDALVSLSNKHTINIDENPEASVPSTLDPHGNHHGTSSHPHDSEQLPSASSIYGLNYDCTYAWNIMSNRVKSFSADDLLSKRSRFGKPSEGQRMGGILIRNAAHAAGLWKDAPCLHEISLAQKKEFYKFIVSVAPQLASNQNVMFIRLREALQNRRKYLLDKKLGKVQARRKRSSSDMGIAISDSGSFVDLSDISDEVDLNSDDFFVKTEDMIKKE